MKKGKYLGLDVHKDTSVVAIAEAAREYGVYGTISGDLGALEKLLRGHGRGRSAEIDVWWADGHRPHAPTPSDWLLGSRPS